ncbi:MAG: pantoate--beta-alanine ligase [Bacteroidales bacterium]|nr:pantoate--beta-alanine ligase [Bacteroidales bacterium]
MNIVSSKRELSEIINDLKVEGKSIGFVPTMGALHEGHLSLMKRSNSDNDVTVVSVFVNPTQFNNPNDYSKYPRIIEEDIAKLKSVKCDILFTPTKEEMYPEEDNREFDFGNLERVMEGKHRPGHFRGVALIVSKLFEAVNPHKAYFGEKDFQQLAIINRLNEKENYGIEIVPCPIIREKDGLAMSSRNMLLSKEQRENVSLISKTLSKSLEQSKNKTVQELKDWVISEINVNKYLDVEYFDVVDIKTLESACDWMNKNNLIGCIAVHVGSIRLIDNIRFYS